MREAADRTERLLTLLVLQNMKGATQREKALQLSLAGFSNVEIANFLDTSPQNVSQVLYESRKKKTGKVTKAPIRKVSRGARAKR